MTKTDAIELFGGVPKLAEALGITRHAIYQWPEHLPRGYADRVVGAAVRLGKMLPCDDGDGDGGSNSGTAVA